MSSYRLSFPLALTLLLCLLCSTTGAHEARPALLRDVGLEQRLDAPHSIGLSGRPLDFRG
jgi:hypothetical protein